MAFGFDDAIAEGLKIVNKFISDPEQAAKAQMEMYGLFQKWDESQNRINEKQAEHPSLFVAGPRPAFMWMGCAAMSWHVMIKPIADYVRMAFWNLPPINLSFNDDALWTLVFGLLGLGGMRSFEKAKGVETTGLAGMFKR